MIDLKTEIEELFETIFSVTPLVTYVDEDRNDKTFFITLIGSLQDLIKKSQKKKRKNTPKEVDELWSIIELCLSKLFAPEILMDIFDYLYKNTSFIKENPNVDTPEKLWDHINYLDDAES